MSRRFKPARPRAPRLLTFGGPIDLVAAKEGDGEGALRRFKLNAYNGGPMRLRWFLHPVIVDLAGLKVSKKARPVLREHDPDRVVGHTGDVKLGARRLDVEGIVSGTGEDAREVVENADNGFPWQVSIGANADKVVLVEEGEKAEVNGKQVTGPIYIARRSTLGELSIVALGADDTTSAKLAASAASTETEVFMGKFEKWLEARGMTLADLTDETAKALRADFDAEQNRTAGEAAPVAPPATPATEPAAVTATATATEVAAAARKARSDELTRQAELSKVFAGKHPEMEAKAIAEEWSLDKARLEVLRAERAVPNVISGAGAWGNQEPDRVLEAALCQAGGLVNVEKSFDAKILEAADRRYRHGIGLQELFIEAARVNGWSGIRFKGNERDVLKAAFSTTSLPGILSNTANKFLMAAFNAVDQAWSQVARIRTLGDFKPATVYRMTGDLKFEKLGPGGEIKHGTVGETNYSIQADTFAKMFAITRQMLINDDLGAFEDITSRLGRGGALRLNLEFWTTFLDNAAFFVGGNNNYFSGADTLLQSSSLSTAKQLFREQVDEDGNPTAILPEILLTPPAIEDDADVLVASREVRPGGAVTGDRLGVFNPHAGKFRNLTTPYIGTSGGIAGSSDVAWYLLANPADMPVIVIGFLNGQRTPFIESAEVDFDRLGVQFRGYFDFGISLWEFRGGVKSKGSA
jgi:hypothetical protein